MKRILLISNGAREHAIAEALMRSPQKVVLSVLAKAVNPGIKALAHRYELGDILDGELAVKIAKEEDVDFAIIGPEAPIEAGVVDALLEAGVHSMAPLKSVGRLETSKSFTRDLLQKYNIEGNPRFQVFYNEEGLAGFLDELGKNYVVKADGLKGGKGVKVAGDHLKSHEEAIEFAKKCLGEVGKVVIEEKLLGQEFSLMSFCDGTTNVFMPVVQDHKRAFINDEGPNTGGMGTYSDSDHSMPFLSLEDIEEAKQMTNAVAAALFEETGIYYKGIMYGGFIATPYGVRLIEYNARFGDPEAMNVLPLLETDFVEICEKLIEGNLDELDVTFANKATVCKYVVPEGYPTNPTKNEKIEIGDVPAGVNLYYASVDERDDGLYLGGSRAVAMVGIANSIEEAEKLAEEAAQAVSGSVFHREDIGTNELISKKVKMMEDLRLGA